MTTTVAIIGAGKVGTSIALALNNQLHPAGIKIRMTDVSASAPDLVTARFHELNMPHDNVTFHGSATEAAMESDIVILATPLSAMKDVVAEIRSTLGPTTILTDTGSAKGKAITQIRSALKGSDINYVPAHPGNGSQGSGPMTGHPHNILGPNSWMFLVEEKKYKRENAAAFARLKEFWDLAGVQVDNTMNALAHDRSFGLCSHLQHVIAFALLESSYKDQNGLEIMKHSGTAFRNLTRVAINKVEEGQPSALVAMWVPILRQNRKQVLYAANNFLKHFDYLLEAVHKNNPTALYNALGEAQAFRKTIKDLEPREDEAGEISDIRAGLRAWTKAPSLELSKEFHKNIEADFYSNMLLPAMIAYGQVMNAKDIAPLFVQGKANPSFRDGTAPALFHPAHMAQYLLEHRDTVLERAASFRASVSAMLEDIRLGKDTSIKEAILSAQAIRNELPGPRKNADVRAQFSIPDERKYA